MNLELHFGKIIEAVKRYKEDIFDSLDCQLYRIRSKRKPCKKGILGIGCRACLSDTIEWLFDDPEEKVQRNCEVYADDIEEVVLSAAQAGINSSCGMYMLRTHGWTSFPDALKVALDSIDCDDDCEKCREDSVKWMSEPATK